MKWFEIESNFNTDKRVVITEIIRVANNIFCCHKNRVRYILECLNFLFNRNHKCILGRKINIKYFREIKQMSEYICIKNGSQQYLIFQSEMNKLF